MKMGKLVLFCLTLALMVASCGPATTTTKTSSVDSTVKKPQPKYAVGQYVWIDGVTKAYIYKDNGISSCGGGGTSSGIGESYYVAYISQSGEHQVSIRENRLFETPDTFYHKIVLPERLYQQIAAEHDTMVNMMITTQAKLKEVETENQINNTWLSHFESHSKITNKTITAQ